MVRRRQLLGPLLPARWPRSSPLVSSSACSVVAADGAVGDDLLAIRPAERGHQRIGDASGSPRTSGGCARPPVARPRASVPRGAATRRRSAAIARPPCPAVLHPGRGSLDHAVQVLSVEPDSIAMPYRRRPAASEPGSARSERGRRQSGFVGLRRAEFVRDVRFRRATLRAWRCRCGVEVDRSPACFDPSPDRRPPCR